MPPQIRSALRDSARRLDQARVDAPAHTARVLLTRAIGCAKEWLIAHDEETLSAEQHARFEELLARVIAHEPMFYVLGKREFFGLELDIDKRVLIPRPETEMLVELALAALKAAPARAGGAEAFDVFDVGAGSGAISIAIAVNAPDARVLAADVSLDALDVARANARKHSVDSRMVFAHSDLLARIDGLPTVLTANLPYVTREEIDGLPPEIQNHEPRVALDGGPDGLVLVRALLGQIAARLPGSALRAAYFEIGASQGAAALAAAHKALPGARCAMLKDLGGHDRVLAIKTIS
jgi:release factor glutamine methyltransferase